MAISGLVITFNEEKFIERCVKTLFKVCDEVIIIDSLSKDKTVEIAQSLGATVISQPFLGDGPQRIFGLQFCKNDWILNVDTDEFIDDDCIAFFQNKEFLNQQYDAYSFRRRNFLKDKEIDFADWYPDYACRFFNKKTASPSTQIVHQRVIATNMCNTNMHLLHYGWENFYQLIAKKNQYTDWQVEEFLKSGKKVGFFSPIIHGISAFIKAYFLKKGIFHGIDGVTFSLIQSFFSYMKYAKALEEIRKKELYK
ncbi:glycosyltransferase family 2 protein [Sphingobacterium sp. SGL-16]|uniref:glycosyltransferase family 2 protein n=1 Tax=Sphingobacterium sp. SGL-16 TaxID=2710883 RepID=UPI0013EBFE39|nr:glycosyltransferase family 2 protein [Sphingobacterium sp. SGL-16]NGM72630.1 glycosyltransferase family 2 protein [Sphingobacterium sp. SGL-16]